VSAPAPPPMPAVQEEVSPRPSPSAPDTTDASEATQAHEPFLDDWEDTFSGGSEEQPLAGAASDLFPERAEAGRTERRKDREEEPSLRELFWGEE
jgi:hypothetical protein